MLTFLKAQVASMVASAVDFVVTIVLVQLTGTSPMLVSLASVEGLTPRAIVLWVVGLLIVLAANLFVPGFS